MPSKELPPLQISRKTGSERFRSSDGDLDFDLLSFWQWSVSDLMSNLTRGIVAEYLVARALDAGHQDYRDEWAAFDLQTKEGVKVEVKSAAYLQSWFQSKPSPIAFDVKKKRFWNRLTNEFVGVPARHADVYVFALLAHEDKTDVEPLDVRQWSFFVVPTFELDKRDQNSITLRALESLCGKGLQYGALRAAVAEAAARQLQTTPSRSRITPEEILAHRDADRR